MRRAAAAACSVRSRKFSRRSPLLAPLPAIDGGVREPWRSFPVQKGMRGQSAEDEPADRRGAGLHGRARLHAAAARLAGLHLVRPGAVRAAFPRGHSAADDGDERGRDGARRLRERRAGDPQHRTSAPSRRSSASARPASPRPRATTSRAIIKLHPRQHHPELDEIAASSMSRRPISRTPSRTAGRRRSRAWSRHWSSRTTRRRRAARSAARQCAAGCHLTPGDLDELRDDHRGLRARADFPARSLRLARRAYPARTSRRRRIGGVGVEAEIADDGNRRLDHRHRRADARRGAKRWRRSAGVPFTLFDRLCGPGRQRRLHRAVLAEISGRPVPLKYRRQRGQLVDAMLDGHFHFGGEASRSAPSQTCFGASARLLTEMGAQICAAVTTTQSPLSRSFRPRRC